MKTADKDTRNSPEYFRTVFPVQCQPGKSYASGRTRQRTFSRATGGREGRAMLLSKRQQGCVHKWQTSPRRGRNEYRGRLEKVLQFRRSAMSDEHHVPTGLDSSLAVSVL